MQKNQSAIAAIAIILLAVAGLLFSFTISNDAEVFVLTSPTTAEVYINDKKVAINNNNPVIKINEGSVSVRVSKDGFEEYRVEKNILKESENIVLASLKPITPEARAILSTPEETAAREEIEGRLLSQKTLSKEFERLSQLVPISSRQYRIDTGVSRQRPGERLAVYITTEREEYIEWALSWLKRQGIDPSQYEYIYRDFGDIE